MGTGHELLLSKLIQAAKDTGEGGREQRRVIAYSILTLPKPEGDLRPEQRTYLEQFVQQCSEVRVAQRLTVEFLQLVREHDHAALAPWLAAAAASGLPEFVEFAKGIMRDRAAVEAALQDAWSNGQTEAQVLQLKAVRRQMRGRGRFALVRRRVVKTA